MELPAGESASNSGLMFTIFKIRTFSAPALYETSVVGEHGYKEEQLAVRGVTLYSRVHSSSFYRLSILIHLSYVINDIHDTVYCHLLTICQSANSR